MQEVSNHYDGCMAVAQLDLPTLEKLIDEHSSDQSVWVSNHNSYDNYTLSAKRHVMEDFIKFCEAKSAEVTMLPVSIASHCEILAEALP